MRAVCCGHAGVPENKQPDEQQHFEDVKVRERDGLRERLHRRRAQPGKISGDGLEPVVHHDLRHRGELAGAHRGLGLGQLSLRIEPELIVQDCLLHLVQRPPRRQELLAARVGGEELALLDREEHPRAGLALAQRLPVLVAIPP